MDQRVQQQKLRGAQKLARIPIKITQTVAPLPKPKWIRIKLPTGEMVNRLKHLLREKRLVTVCEEASCPNLLECFSQGTATFMIMGDKCTRRCSFCDVAHGRPDLLDEGEPENLAVAVAQMGLKYVVITSVDRDDLRDGGAAHFAACIGAVRKKNPGIKVEILVPDFRGRAAKALDCLAAQPADVFNHNIETVPRLYKQARPGSDYEVSLQLLQSHKERFPDIPTKSGIMLGLGEHLGEVEQAMRDLRTHAVSRLTLGQYLQPSKYHLPVRRYVTPTEFNHLGQLAKELGFTHVASVASGPLLRSSYHADLQAKGEQVS